MDDNRTMDSMAEVDNQLARVEDRLVDDFGDENREIVHRVVDEERARFDDASVHAFVPVLVERSARSRLDES